MAMISIIGPVTTSKINESKRFFLLAKSVALLTSVTEAIKDRTVVGCSLN